VTFATPLPWWAFCLVAVAAALVAREGYRRFTGGRLRRYCLVALRFLTLLLIVLFLMRPVLRTSEPDARNLPLPVLVDVSRSMGIEDADGARRIDRARDLLTQALLPELSRRFDVEVLGFGDELTRVSAANLSATGRQSNLQSALAAVGERYRGRPVPGVVVLSDGGETSAAVPHGEVGIPVFAVGIGAPAIAHDSEVLSVTTAEAVLDGSRIDLAVAAVSHGRGTEAMDLRLLENGRPLEVRRVVPSADGTPLHEVFQVSPARGGPTVYTVEIPTAVSELVPENNSRSVLVQPPARSRRILLVEGAPGFEHSFLKRAWAADRDLEIDSVVRKGRNEQGRDTFYIQAAESRSGAFRSGYPAGEDDLFRYDALVLANVEGHQLTRKQLEATRKFVGTRGGGLLVLGGRSFLQQGLVETAVEDVLPLNLQDRTGGVLPAAETRGNNRVTLTPEGAAHPVMQLAPGLEDTRKRWDNVPTLAAIAPLGGPRPGAAILALTGGAGGVPRALVAVQRFGDGRSMIFTGEAAWRWRMMLPAADRSYDTFWRQAVRWLALPASDPVAITLPPGAVSGTPVPIQVAVRNAAFEAVRDAAVDVRVARADGRLEQLRATPDPDAPASGRYVARFDAGDTGVYRVTAEARRGSELVGSTSAALLVGGVDLEMTDPRLNEQVLERIAAATGGKLFAASDVGGLVTALEANSSTAALTVRVDLWHNGWSFAALLVLLSTEWLLRRRWGLR
jgi:uncharacterized membrane protein